MASNSDYFNSQALTIGALFGNSDSFFQIPRYQRPYRWEDEQVEQLWDDLENEFNNGSNSYFIGSIITAKPKDDSAYLDIVDGQQRMITLLILFAVIRDTFPTINANTSNPRDITINTLKDAIKKETNHYRLRIETHPNHRTDFEEIIIKGDTKNISKPKKKDIKKDVEPKYKFQNSAAILSSKVSSKSVDKIGNFVNFVFNNVYVIKIGCNNVEAAIKIFQILNNRGLDLTNADLIKSFLIEKIHKDLPYEGNEEGTEEYKSILDSRLKEEDAFNAEWSKLELTVKNLDENLNSLFILYQYYLTASNPKKSLYEELVDKLKNIKSIEVIHDFNKFVNYYNNHIQQSKNLDIFALKYLRWGSFWKSILLTAFHTGYSNHGQLEKTLKRYYFLYWIAGKTLPAIKQTSFNIIKLIKENKPFTEIQDLIDKKIAEDRIIELALDSLNGDIYHTAWGKPILCMIENNQSDKPVWIPLTRDLHIDHIIPLQHKNEEWPTITSEFLENSKHTGANLTLLSGYKNIEASNSKFSDKVAAYTGKGLYDDSNSKITSFLITQKIVNDYNQNLYNKTWNMESVKDRWIWFCEEVGKILSIDTTTLKEVTFDDKVNRE